jgi:hypothetical protein
LLHQRLKALLLLLSLNLLGLHLLTRLLLHGLHHGGGLALLALGALHLRQLIHGLLFGYGVFLVRDDVQGQELLQVWGKAGLALLLLLNALLERCWVATKE